MLRLTAVLRVAVVHGSQVQDQLSGVVSLQCRHGNDCLMDATPQSLQVLPGFWQVHFVSHDGMRSVGQMRFVLVQFEAQLLELFPGLCRRHIQHIQQNTAALDVPQERDPEPAIQMSSRNQPGNISDCSGKKKGLVVW